MTPLSFDSATAREICGDASARKIEAIARSDADNGTFSPPVLAGQTYWAQVQNSMMAVVYRDQHDRRTARNKRIATPQEQP